MMRNKEKLPNVLDFFRMAEDFSIIKSVLIYRPNSLLVFNEANRLILNETEKFFAMVNSCMYILHCNF